jgi:nucleoside-diphosphate-sugar epimerase
VNWWSALAAQHGANNVIAFRHRPDNVYGAARYTRSTCWTAALWPLVADEGITQVYQLAALLSATGEKAPLKAWTLNMDGLLNILEVARERGDRQAAEGVLAVVDRRLRPEHRRREHAAVHGDGPDHDLRHQQAGRRAPVRVLLHAKYGVDVRSIRYPGIISFKSPPGGGTTDYAIAIFHSALRGETYECFLGPETTLPMIYMPDAIRATIELMDAPAEQVKIRSSYNVAGVSFNPRELAAAITRAAAGL